MLTLVLYTKNMEEHPDLYFSYLLRMWRSEAGGQVIWRASLESPQTGTVVLFKDPAQMYSFLNQEMERLRLKDTVATR
ncbi:MAG: hypothetical protein JW862_18605 [Anaerolineales bacterium]|nr:hypothetical protein [Anaerolineales bacterium]